MSSEFPESEHSPELDEHSSVSQPEDVQPPAPANGFPDVGLVVESPKRRSRKVAVIGVVVLALTLTGIGGWWWFGRTDRNYLAALQAQGVSNEFKNQDVAIVQGKAFCVGLEAGDEAVGYKRQKIAVDAYCPSFASGFEVIPTPEEQAKSLLDQLRSANLGGLFTSDAQAVAHAKDVCRRLDKGGEAKGVLADSIGVKVYCSEYAAGFRVLEEIVVHGVMTIANTGGYFPTVTYYGKHCSGSSGYSDIDEGTDVTVTNSEGKVLAETELEQGSPGYYSCKFEFTFTVLEGETKYLIEVGKRGKLSYTEAELKIPDRVHPYLG